MKVYRFIFKPENMGYLNRKFGPYRYTLKLRDLINHEDIKKYFDLDDYINKTNIEDIKSYLKEFPDANIVFLRYLKNDTECMMYIGNLFNDIPCLTDTLNLPKGNENWRERVRLRKEYIDKELKKDPNKVFWDYADYLGGNPTKDGTTQHPLQTLDHIKVSNKGLLITKFNNVIGDLSSGENSRLLYIDLHADVLDDKGIFKTRTVRKHRLIASTYIPMPDHIYELYMSGESEVLIDHVDMNKQNDIIDNLEWVTKGENTIRMMKKNKIIKHLTVTIASGEHEGYKFVVYGNEGLRALGMKANADDWSRCKVKLGCMVRESTEEEIKTLPREFKDLEYFKQFQRVGFVGTNRPVQYYFKPVIGPFKGKEFKVTGKTLELVLKRKRIKIQHGDNISLGCIWNFENVDKSVDDFPQEFVDWVESNRKFILDTDGMIKRKKCDNDTWEYGHITDFIKGVRIPHITREKRIGDFVYCPTGVKEALDNGYTY